jgi:TrwC relaxase
MHPLAAQRLEQLPDADLTDDNIRAAIWLGAPFKVMEASPNRFRIEVARDSLSMPAICLLLIRGICRPKQGATVDGRWLSIDGRVLFKATVAASETHNTALEHHLQDQLGVRFAERSDRDPRKPAVREIVGVDEKLTVRWSARRQVIKNRSAALSVQFQRDHGRKPTPVEALHLARQATLETPRCQA